MIRLFIKGIAYDANNNPIILLTDEKEEMILPVWIGLLEAHSIAVAIEGMALPRPMTHDLMVNLLNSMEACVNSVIISDVKDNTFYAELHLDTPRGELVIDSRPSDAIALAIKSSAPVFLNESLSDNMFKIKDILDEDVQEELDKFFNSDAFKEHKKSLH